MEHDPRTPKQNVENPVDFQETDPAAEASDAIEGIEEVADQLGLVQPAMAGESTDAGQFPDLPAPMAASTGGAEEMIDVPAQTGFEDPSAPALDAVEITPASASSSGMAGQDFDGILRDDASTRDTNFLNDTEPVAPPIGDLLLRPGEPVVIERGPHVPGEDSDRRPIKLLDDTAGASEQTNESASTADLSARTKGLLSPTSDGGPPLARPIVIVSLADVQQNRIREEALAAAAERDNKTTGEIAEEKVNYAFWVRNCEERALWGDY